MAAAVILTALGMGTLLPYISFRLKGKAEAQKLFPGLIIKIGVSMCFILTTCAGILAGSARFDQYKYLFLGILAGQVFGLLGDYWLDMKDMYPAYREPYMFAGFGSFFICHLFFNAGLFLTYRWGVKNWLVILGAGVVLCAFVMVTEKPMKLKYGRFKLITGAYSFIFGVSIAASLVCWFVTKQPQALVMCVGLVVFLLSDLFLSGTYFGVGKDKTFDIAANYIAYYGGQFVIALSLLWMK